MNKTLEDATKDYKAQLDMGLGEWKWPIIIGWPLAAIILTLRFQPSLLAVDPSQGIVASYFGAAILGVAISSMGGILIGLGGLGLDALRNRGKSTKSDYQIIRESMAGGQVIEVTPYRIVIEKDGYRYSFGTSDGVSLRVE